MAQSLYDLVVNISANTASLTTGLSTAANSVNTSGKQISSAMEGAKKAVEALAGAFAVERIFEWGKGVVEAAEKLNHLSSATGSSVEALSRLSNQAQIAGTSFDTFEGFLLKFGRSLGTSKDATNDTVRALQYLKVSASDPAEALQQVITKMASYNDGVGKIALATALFGRNGQEFLATLNNMAKLQDVVATRTAEQARQAEELAISIRRLGVESQTFAQILLSNVVPALDSYASAVLKAKQSGLGWWDALATSIKANSGSVLGAIAEQQQQVDKLRATYANALTNPPTFGADKFQAQAKQNLADAQKQLDVLKQIEVARVKALGYTGDARDQQAGNSAASISANRTDAEFSLRAQAMSVKVSSALAEINKQFEIVRQGWASTLAVQQDISQRESSILESQHSLDLVSEQDFISKRLALQTNAAQQATIAARAEFQSYTAQLDAVLATPVTGKDAGQLADNATKKREELDKLFAKIIESYGKLTIAEAKEGDAANVAADAWEGFRQKQDAALTTIVQRTNDYVDNLVQQEVAQQVVIAGIGQTAEAQEKLRVGYDLELTLKRQLLAIDREIEALSRTPEAAVTNARQITELRQTAADLVTQTAQTKATLFAGIDVASNLNKFTDAWKQMFTDLATAGANFITDFVQHGTSAFKNLWNNFKNWALQAFAEIAAKTVIVNVAAALGLGGLAGQALGSTGVAGQLGGLSGVGNLFSAGSALAGVGSAFATGYAGVAGGAAGFYGTGAAIGTVAAGELGSGGILAGLSAGLAAIPVAGWIALGGLIIAGIASGLDKGPAERTAQFGSNSGLGAGNPLFQSRSSLGSFGVFNDSFFSNADQGQAIQTFLSGISTIDNAIANMVGPQTVQQIETRLAAVQTTFSAGVEHQATEFGSILQDRYKAVLDAIDPELGALAAAFQGTGDQFTKFVTEVVGVYETLKTVDTQSLFGQAVTVTDIANLTQSGQSVASTFTNLVQVFQVTDSIAQVLGQDMTTAFGAVGLAGAQARQGLVNLLGGNSQAGQVVTNYLSVAFTDAQRNALSAATATATLNQAFAGLGRAVPHTWDELNQLIRGLDLSSDAGQQAAAILLGQVVPAFAVVHGSAQDAANALQQAAQAIDAAHQSATGLFNSNFLSPAEQANANTTAVGLANRQFGDAIQEAFGGVRTQIPATIAGFHDFIISLQQTGQAGSQLADTIVNDVGQAIVDLNTKSKDATDSLTNLNQAITTLSSQAQPHTDLVQSQLDVIGNAASGGKFGALTAQAHFLAGAITDVQNIIANALPGSDGARLAQQQLNQLTPINARITADLATYVSLRAQYGNDIADQLFQLQKTHDANVDLFSGSTQALADFEASFHQQWQDIINGTSADLQKLIDKIHDYLKQLTTSDLSPLSPTEKFNAAQDQFHADLTLAQAGNADALGRITSEADTYLRAAHDAFASGAESAAAFNDVVQSLTGLDTGPAATNANTTIAAAMPQGSTVASAADTVALGDRLTDELSDVKSTLAQLLVRIGDATDDVANEVSNNTRVTGNQAALTVRA